MERMFGISLHPSETPLNTENTARLTSLNVQALRFHLPVGDVSRAQATVASLAGFSGTLLAVLDLQPSDREPDLLVRRLVDQLKGRIQHWEIASEPDDPRWGWPEDDLISYAACLKAVAHAIHQADPAAKVHNGGLGRSLPKGIARLYELGAGKEVDIWNVHPYMNPLMPDSIGGLKYFHDMIRKTVDDNGDRAKPIWWTSIACPGMTDPKTAKDWWLGKNPTETIQAEWVKTVLLKPRSWGVTAVFWQDLLDHPATYNNGCDAFGLYHADGSVKASAEMFRQHAQAVAS